MKRNGHCWRCETACTERCSRCRVAFYCSKECQKQDTWRHEPECDAAALKRKCMGCGKEDEGMLRCSTCAKAWYCSAKCQKKEWGNHKSQCHDIVEKTINLATTIKEDRDLNKQAPGMSRTYYWGNVPAVDLLNMSMNEGETYPNPLALLLCGVGDPRNVLLTIASLPDVYKQKVTFVLNDICPCTLARTILLLYLLYKGKWNLCFNFENIGSVIMTNEAFHGAGSFKGVNT